MKPNPTKLIFLDLEGVVVTQGSIESVSTRKINPPNYMDYGDSWGEFVNPVAMGLIFLLAEEFDAEIVLTSTIRFKNEVRIALDRIWVQRSGGGKRILDVTPRAETREWEIREYLNREESKAVTHYVVIDDRYLLIDNFVLVDPHDGFSFGHYNKCRELLCDDVAKLESKLILL